MNLLQLGSTADERVWSGFFLELTVNGSYDQAGGGDSKGTPKRGNDAKIGDTVVYSSTVFSISHRAQRRGAYEVPVLYEYYSYVYGTGTCTS